MSENQPKAEHLMIQRIQSIYLLLAFAACMTCLCLPAAHLLGGELEGMADVYNLWIGMPDGSYSFDVWALFPLLLLAASLSFIAIFLFRNRILQLRLCTFAILLLVGWYGVYGSFAYMLCLQWDASFRVHWSGALPFVAIVLIVFAMRGIWKDERLVKSLDRLR